LSCSECCNPESHNSSFIGEARLRARALEMASKVGLRVARLEPDLGLNQGQDYQQALGQYHGRDSGHEPR